MKTNQTTKGKIGLVGIIYVYVILQYPHQHNLFYRYNIYSSLKSLQLRINCGYDIQISHRRLYNVYILSLKSATTESSNSSQLRVKLHHFCGVKTTVLACELDNEPFSVIFFYFWMVVLALYREMGRDGNSYQMQQNYGVTYTNQTVPKSNLDHENY